MKLGKGYGKCMTTSQKLKKKELSYDPYGNYHIILSVYPK